MFEFIILFEYWLCLKIKCCTVRNELREYMWVHRIVMSFISLWHGFCIIVISLNIVLCVSNIWCLNHTDSLSYQRVTINLGRFAFLLKGKIVLGGDHTEQKRSRRKETWEAERGQERTPNRGKSEFVLNNQVRKYLGRPEPLGQYLSVQRSKDAETGHENRSRWTRSG